MAYVHFIKGGRCSPLPDGGSTRRWKIYLDPGEIQLTTGLLLYFPASHFVPSESSRGILRHIIIEDQYGAICNRGCIAAKELQKIRIEVVVIIQLKTQAELRTAYEIEERVAKGIDLRKIPAGCLET